MGLTQNELDLIDQARAFAVSAHKNVSQKYGKHDYSYHLAGVAARVQDWVSLLPREDWATAIAGAWVHDTIEDAQQTYNDVCKATSVEVAEVAYALTNEKGRTREERASPAYYAGIRANDVFVLVKLADRLANFSHAIATESRMVGVYSKEMPKFIQSLLGDNPENHELWPMASLLMEKTVLC